MRAAAGDHLVEHHTEREDVGRGGGRRTAPQFRRHVAGCAAGGSLERRCRCGIGGARQSEVGDDGAGVAAGARDQYDVAGLQIAVDDALTMCLGDAGRNLNRNGARLGERNGAAEQAAGERFASRFRRTGNT